MHKSVMICLNKFMKLNRHGDIQCILCSLSLTFRGYYLSYSISCSLSFLTKRSKTLTDTVSGKVSGHVSSLEMTETQ